MIGERLFDLRKDSGLTQDALADVLKINKHSISSYERDKSEPPDAIKIAIAEYFHVSVDYLLGVTDNPLPAVFTSDYLRLPQGFPAEAQQELLRYAGYLKQVYAGSNGRKK